jgi:hypothetical protein
MDNTNKLETPNAPLPTIPVDPYYISAATWWLKNRNDNQLHFNLWLCEQGVVLKKRKEYTPYLEFNSQVESEIFRIKWSVPQ